MRQRSSHYRASGLVPGHRAARQVFEKPPFTPKTTEFGLATCEWPVYTQIRTLAPTSAMAALWRNPPLTMNKSSGGSGHRAARQVFEKPPFTPKTAEFGLATCEWPVYTQLRTLAPTSAMAALWWKPTLGGAALSFLERRFLTGICGTPTAGSEERNLSGSFPAPILAGLMSTACPVRPVEKNGSGPSPRMRKTQERPFIML